MTEGEARTINDLARKAANKSASAAARKVAAESLSSIIGKIGAVGAIIAGLIDIGLLVKDLADAIEINLPGLQPDGGAMAEGTAIPPGGLKPGKPSMANQRPKPSSKPKPGANKGGWEDKPGNKYGLDGRLVSSQPWEMRYCIECGDAPANVKVTYEDGREATMKLNHRLWVLATDLRAEAQRKRDKRHMNRAYSGIKSIEAA
jgi:hypothetical protein